jgi:dephospho-CoA kinase
MEIVLMIKKTREIKSIVHPAVRAHFKIGCKHFQETCFMNRPFYLRVVNTKDFDYIISVTAPLESRIARVLERDNTSREAVLAE